MLERALEETRPQSSTASSASSVKSTQMAPSTPKPEVQVFQKGPQVTTLVANLPGLEVGNKSPTETKQILPTVQGPTKPTEDIKVERVKSHEKISSPNTGKLHKSKKKDSHLHSARSTNSLDIESTVFAKCKHNHVFEKNKRVVDYSSETSTPERKPHRRNSESHQAHMEQRQRHIRDARSSLFDLVEKDKLNGKLDFDSEPSYIRPSSVQLTHKSVDTMSQKSLDYSSESSSRYYKKHTDPRIARPIPPKKPLRLSLHRATSLQSVEVIDKKSLKRAYKGENSHPGLLWPSAVSSLHNAATYCVKNNLAEKWC